MSLTIEYLRNKLGATVTGLTVSYDRKVSDGNYGSVGGFFSMTVDLDPEANAEEVASALFVVVRTTAEANLTPAFKSVLNGQNTKEKTWQNN